MAKNLGGEYGEQYFWLFGARGSGFKMSSQSDALRLSSKWNIHEDVRLYERVKQRVDVRIQAR